MKMNVIIERIANNWTAYTPDDGFCVIATAKSRTKLIERFREAVKDQIGVLREDGHQVPEITELEIHETLAFAESVA